MTYLTSATALSVMTLMVAGCSSSGGDETVSQQAAFEARAEDSAEMGDRIDSLSNTAFVAMPVTGTASYDGYAGVILDTGGDGTVLLGDAAVTANFGSGTIRGTFDNFEGGRNPDAVRTYDGQLRMAGDIGIRRPNSFDTTVIGTLTGPGQVIDLAGPLFGDFRGSGGRAIGGVTDETLLAEVNGRSVGGAVFLIGE